MNISYKQLSGSDVHQLKELLKVFGDAFGEPQTYQGAVPGNDYLKSLLGKDHFIALAALDQGRVAGGLTAYVLEKFEQERKEVYIYDLAVAAAYRRQGIATGLMKALKAVAQKLGAYVIFVQADQVDTQAIRLYESLGKKENVYQFDIPIE